MQTSTVQPHSALRFLLLMLSSVFALVSFITLFFIITRELDSYFGISIFFLVTATVAVLLGKKRSLLANLGKRGVSLAGSIGQEMVARYDVVYKGGLPEYPSSKMGKIHMEILPDRFNFVPTIGTKWFAGLAIPFNAITDLQIVQRQVNSFEGIVGGLGSRQLNQLNNIHISFYNNDGCRLVLRLEMLSGFTVMGQAVKCREFEDRLRTAGIRDHFYNAPATSTVIQVAAAAQATATNEIPAQIEKLAQLRDKGLLTAMEFDAKKTELLARM